MDNLLLNERLTKLYEDHWDKFCKEVKKSNICIGYPFLLSTCQWKGNLSTERWYTDSDLKVMIFGQEPNKWHGIDRCDDFNSTSQFYTGDKPETVGSIMSIYENFYATRYLPNCNHPNAYPKVKPDYYKYVEAIIYDIHSNLNNLLK